MLSLAMLWAVVTGLALADGSSLSRHGFDHQNFLGQSGHRQSWPDNRKSIKALSSSSRDHRLRNVSTHGMGLLDRPVDVDANVAIQASNLPWIAQDDFGNIFLASIFTLALILVALEDVVHINKAAVLMLTAATMWAFIFFAEVEGRRFQMDMKTSLDNVGAMLIFLLAAMGIVESIAHFGGFNVVLRAINSITVEAPWRLMPVICACTFLLSAFIDNFTSTIVALKVLSISLKNEHDFRRACGTLAVIAANSGGAWSPMGDVTTTMLWMAGKVTPMAICKNLILPAMVSVAVPYLFISRRTEIPSFSQPNPQILQRQAKSGAWELVVLTLGMLCMVLAPFLKLAIDLPPYMSMLLGLGFFWTIMDLSSWCGPQRDHPGSKDAGVPAALSKLDLSTLLFFGGVLFGVGALEHAGLLKLLTEKLVSVFGLAPLKLSFVIGVASAAIDNVPIVDASIEMFAHIASVDDELWQLIALAAGTGGSILIIGSAAGLVLMGQEKVSFFWYLTNASPWAFIGYCAGLVTYAHHQIYLVVALVLVCVLIYASPAIQESGTRQAETKQAAKQAC